MKKILFVLLCACCCSCNLDFLGNKETVNQADIVGTWEYCFNRDVSMEVGKITIDRYGNASVVPDSPSPGIIDMNNYTVKIIISDGKCTWEAPDRDFFNGTYEIVKSERYDDVWVIDPYDDGLGSLAIGRNVANAAFAYFGGVWW